MTNLPAMTNAFVAAPGIGATAPDMGASVLRVGGALIAVIGLFFAGVWLFKNWRRFAARNGRAPKLNVLEVKSLGQRHAIYVIGYEQQRMLLAASPGGVSLLSHLPAAEEVETTPAPSVAPAPAGFHFASVLQQALSPK